MNECGPTAAQGKPWERPGRAFRRIALSWLAFEFGAGILALAVVVAIGPWVVVLLSRPALPWVATAAVLAVSIPVSVVLASSALKVSRGLMAPALKGGDEP